MIKGNRILTGVLIFLFACCVAIYTVPFPVLIESNVNQLAYLLMAFLPVAGSLYSLRLYGTKSGQGKVFIFMSLAFLFLFLGELIWTIFLFMHIDPFPSLADYFYILFYPFLFFALLKQLKVSQVDWKMNSFTGFIFLLLTLILVTVVFYFELYFAYDSTVSFLQNAVLMAYGIGDLVLIFLTFFVLRVADEFKGGRIFYGWLTFSMALFITLLADIGFAIFTDAYEGRIVWALRMMDMLWILSFLLFAHALFTLGNIVKEAQKKALKG